MNCNYCTQNTNRDLYKSKCENRNSSKETRILLTNNVGIQERKWGFMVLGKKKIANEI